MSDDDSGIRCASLGKLPSRQEQVVLAKAVGARLREARELAGMSQVYAAKQLGYSNSSKLAKIEGGKDSSQIPMWVIKRSARLYDASIDYLLGNTETMERGDVDHAALRELNALILADTERQRVRDAVALCRLRQRVVTVERLVGLMAEQITEADQARAKVEQSEEWQEVRGGSRWANATEQAVSTARTAVRTLKRLHVEASMARLDTLQFNLILE